jgi:hypothetical protein
VEPNGHTVLRAASRFSKEHNVTPVVIKIDSLKRVDVRTCALELGGEALLGGGYLFATCNFSMIHVSYTVFPEMYVISKAPFFWLLQLSRVRWRNT